MNTTLYILGSGIMDNRNVMPFSCALLTACLFAWLACRVLKKGSERNEYQVCLFSLLCFASILIGIHLLAEGAEKGREDKLHVEKIEFEHHDYLLFGGGGIIHDPACACRKPFRK